MGIPPWDRAMSDALEQIINRNDTWRGRLRRFHHHEPSANSGSHSCTGLATGYRRIQKADTLLLGRLCQLTCKVGRGRSMVY